MNALGIDVSRNNGQVDWQVAVDHGVIFAGMRASISWGYRDGWLPANQVGTHELGIHRFYYHVLYPGESALLQVNNFLAAVGDHWEDAFPVLDIELDHGYTPQTITACMLDWLRLVEERTGKHPIIYSRAEWINHNTVRGSWRYSYDWWLAAYLNDRTQERPAPPPLPTGASTWLVHQNADKYVPWEGLQNPNESRTLDIDRWNGDKSAVDAYFGAQAPVHNVFLPAIFKWASNHQPDPYTGPGPELQA